MLLSNSGRVLCYLNENADHILVWDDHGAGMQLTSLAAMPPRVRAQWELVFLSTYMLDGLLPAPVHTPAPSPMVPPPNWPPRRVWTPPSPLPPGPKSTGHREENFTPKRIGKTKRRKVARLVRRPSQSTTIPTPTHTPHPEGIS